MIIYNRKQNLVGLRKGNKKESLDFLADNPKGNWELTIRRK